MGFSGGNLGIYGILIGFLGGYEMLPGISIELIGPLCGEVMSACLSAVSQILLSQMEICRTNIRAEDFF